MYVCVGLLLPACNAHSKARSAPANTTPNDSAQFQGGGTPTVNVNFNGAGSIYTQVKLDVSLYDIKTTCTKGNVDWELYDGTTRIAEDKSTDNPNIYKKLNCTTEKSYNLKLTSTETEPTSATIVFKY